MRNQLETQTLRALATEALKVVAAHDANAPWVDTGRWRSLCRGCGAPCDPDRRWCSHCSAALP